MIEKDKVKHFVYCAVATFFVGAIIGPTYGVCIGAGLGFGKEYGDMVAKGNTWSWGDVLADALGIITGALLAFLIRLIGGLFYG